MDFLIFQGTTGAEEEPRRGDIATSHPVPSADRQQCGLEQGPGAVGTPSQVTAAFLTIKMAAS